MKEQEDNVNTGEGGREGEGGKEREGGMEGGREGVGFMSNS